MSESDSSPTVGSDDRKFARADGIHLDRRGGRISAEVAMTETALAAPRKGDIFWMSRQDWRRSWAPWLRGTGLGFPFGVLPAGGAELPTFLSYTYERKRSKGKYEFGKGAIEGVAGPEAANNASFSGVLVPLLTLGLPTSATAPS